MLHLKRFWESEIEQNKTSYHNFPSPQKIIHARQTYMLTNAVEKIAGQQFHCAPPQCFLLPLHTEHKELLLLLLTERLAVTHLKGK